MTYTIVTSPQQRQGANVYDAVIAIVGCGGTGGFLAEAVCRLLLGRHAELFLIDHDRVESHNCLRQAFGPEDVGKFKAQVLAERLSRRYHRNIGYSVMPFDWDLHGHIWTKVASRLPLVIGCVDNAAARSALADAMRDGRPEPIGYAYRTELGHPWWLDLGNERNSGQALLGNLVQSDHLAHAFQYQGQTVTALPAPSQQRPDLLTSPPRRQPEADCAERVITGDQGATINQAMAALGASFVEKLLDGRCTWMAALLNMDEGILAATAPEPRRVAALTGLHVNKLVYRYDEAERITQEADAGNSPLVHGLGAEAEHTAAEAAHQRAERKALVEAMVQTQTDPHVDQALPDALATTERATAAVS
jgi:PRTRC genetic system ThiF family protein